MVWRWGKSFRFAVNSHSSSGRKFVIFTRLNPDIMYKFVVAAFVFFQVFTVKAQAFSEVSPPYNIKSAAFIQANQHTIPVFALGDRFVFQFDDLFGNEANYYYQIQHCNYDWTPSGLVKSEYLNGFDDLRIQNYTNSFNTLQIYSHYKLPIPNSQTQLRVSGNYILKILNQDREVVFSRKFILYEDLVSVPLQVRRARRVADVPSKQNLEFSILSQQLIFQNPLKNVQVLLMQNGRFDNAITNIKPQYTIGNDLIYKYDTETQFWAGNEFWYFDNKDIRGAGNNVARVDSKGSLYNAYLFTNDARAHQPYTYYPDINGNFLPHNLNAQNSDVEADYAWVYFSLSAPMHFSDKKIYVNGMFNNYARTPEFALEYDATRKVYEKAIMIKQGFTNYQYVVGDAKGIDESKAVDGNFFQTEHNYMAIVYYRENNARYDRVIGRGVASSTNMQN